MKTVFDNSTVAHVWANQSQNEGRNANGSFYFSGNKIFSYGSHFLIACHYLNEDTNENVVLFTTRSYSNTTAKQINYVRQSVNGKRLIFCYNPNGTSHSENFNSWIGNMNNYAGLMLNARKPEKYLNLIANEYNECKVYADFFKISIPAEIILLSELQNKSEYSALQDKRKEIAIEAEKTRLAKLKKDHKEMLNKWRSFKTNRVGVHNGLDYLRFNSDKNRIETSQAVEIPAQTALQFYQYILDTISKGGCIDCGCNHKLMNYDVKEINSKFIVVGCHKVEMSEIKKAVKWLL